MTGLTPDITTVAVIRLGVLRLEFADGLAGEVDVLSRMRGPVFAHARTPAGFQEARVDRETGTVVWPGGADLARNRSDRRAPDSRWGPGWPERSAPRFSPGARPPGGSHVIGAAYAGWPRSGRENDRRTPGRKLRWRPARWVGSCRAFERVVDDRLLVTRREPVFEGERVRRRAVTAKVLKPVSRLGWRWPVSAANPPER